MPKRRRKPQTKGAAAPKNCSFILVFNDFEDEQLINLPILMEVHNINTYVEILVETGTDKERFARLMMNVRKEVSDIQFKVFMEIPTKKMHEIERQYEAGGTFFEYEF